MNPSGNEHIKTKNEKKHDKFKSKSSGTVHGYKSMKMFHLMKVLPLLLLLKIEVRAYNLMVNNIIRGKYNFSKKNKIENIIF